MARTDRFCFAALLAGVVAAASSYEESGERSDYLCRDHGIGCSPGGAFDTSAESSFDFDDLFKDIKNPGHVDTQIREDHFKEIDHPVEVGTHIRKDQYKEIDHPDDVGKQIIQHFHKEMNHPVYVDTQVREDFHKDMNHPVYVDTQVREDFHKELNHPIYVGTQIREDFHKDINHPVYVDTQVREDFHKELNHPIYVNTQIREDFHKDIEHPVNVDTQIREDSHKDIDHPVNVNTQIREDSHKDIDHPVNVDVQIREDSHKDIDHPANVDVQIREDFHKEMSLPIAVETQVHKDQFKDIQQSIDIVNTQIQHVPENVGNHKAPEPSPQVFVTKEVVPEIVKNPNSGTSFPREEPPASVVAIKVPVKNDTNIVGSTDLNMKGNENVGKNTANNGIWPNSVHQVYGNIPVQQKPFISVDGNSFYAYQQPGNNGKLELYSYWGPGTVIVKEPSKKPPAPKPKPEPENPIMNVGSSLLREIVRVPLAIKTDLERFARKLLKFTGKGVKGLINEAKRIIVRLHGFFRDGTNAIMTKIEELLRKVIAILSGTKMNLPSEMT